MKVANPHKTQHDNSFKAKTSNSLTGAIKWRFRRAVKYPATLFTRTTHRPTIIKPMG